MQREGKKLTRYWLIILSCGSIAASAGPGNSLWSLTMALKHVQVAQGAPEVEVEYVSAPHEYEELLQSEPKPESDAAGAAGLESSGGGLGFVSAGPSGADSGL